MLAPPPQHFPLFRKIFWRIDYSFDYLLYLLFCRNRRDLEDLLHIRGMSFFTELSFLFTAAQIAPDPGVIVEIGAYQGRVSSTLARATVQDPGKRIYSIDPLANAVARQTFLENIRKTGAAHKIEPIYQLSTDAIRDWQKPISMLFIDGDHSYEAVKRDFEDWSAHLVENGLLIFHDSNFPGVARLLSEITEQHTFHWHGRLASISVFSRNPIVPSELLKFYRLNRFRSFAAHFSNFAKRLARIDNTKWR